MDWPGQSLAVWEDVGEPAAVARIRRNQARVALAKGDIPGAEELLRGALAAFRCVGWGQLVAFCLDGLAGAASLSDRPERALRLAGAAAALRRARGTQVPIGERPELDRWLAPACRALGARGGEVRREGETMTMGEACTLALDADA